MPKRKKKNKVKKPKNQVKLGESMAKALTEVQRKLTIAELWEEHSQHYLKSVAERLTFNYKTKDQAIVKQAMIPALALWRFIRRNASDAYVHFNGGQGETERKEFIEKFLVVENRYIRLVAMIELMPIVLWRRIIWRANIDFVSHESFLRRLQPEHWLAIEANFVDWQNHATPRILTAKEAKILDWQQPGPCERPSVHPKMRHISKPAWTKNLFSFDFGFNKYPGGDNNDSQILNTADQRRIHSSNNSKDFVVNTEFGRYMRLYRSARSNYVIRPNHDVELKTHICPGYWATILIHLMFWILSPATAIGLLATANSNHLPTWCNIMLLIPAMITPLWLLCAAIKFFFVRVDNWIDNLGGIWFRAILKFVERICKEYPRTCEKAFILCLSLLSGLGTFVLSRFVLKMFPAALAGIIIATLVGHTLHRAIMQDDEERQPMSLYIFIPLYLACLYVGGLLAIKWSPYLVKGLCWLAKYTFFAITKWLPALGIAMIEFAAWLWMHASNLVTSYFVPAIKYLLLGILSVGFFWLIILIPLCLMGLLYFAYCKLSKEAQTNLDYLIDKVCYYGIFLITGTMGLACIFTAYDDSWTLLSGQTLTGVLIIGFIAAIAAFSTRFMAQELNPEIKQLKEDNQTILCNVNRRGLFNYRYMVENTWFKALSLEEKTEQAKKIDNFVASIMPTKQEGAAIAMIMKRINSFNVMERIMAAAEDFCTINAEYRLPIIKIMLKNALDFDDALSIYLKRKEHIKNGKKIGAILFKVLFAPIYYPGMFLWWLGGKTLTVAQHILDFRRMAKAIKDFCPYIIKPEIID